MLVYDTAMMRGFETKTHLGFDHTIFGTRNQNETFYFQEIREFRRIKFARTNRVAFLVVLCE